MPTPRLPTPILIARGAFKKDPQRAKAREAEPIVTDPIGPPPACFIPTSSGVEPGDRKRKEHFDLWYELIGDCAPGVLNRSHRWYLESAVRLKLKERKETISTGESTNLEKHLSKLGMNPADQSRVDGGSFAPPAGQGGTLASLHARSQALRTG
jgi:hypothetical protein